MTTHRDVCRAVAAWFLDQRWCAVSGWELAGGRVADPSRDRTYKHWQTGEPVLSEGRKGTVLDAIGVSAPLLPLGDAGRVAVAECKRTRADLLGDLRERKMLGYAELEGVSHLYLAATAEAFGFESRREEILGDLLERGLPPSWGVLHVRPGVGVSGLGIVTMVRGPKGLREPTSSERTGWLVKIARSHAYRALHRETV